MRTLLIAALLAAALLAIGTPARAQEAPPGCQAGIAPAGASDGCDTDNVNVLPGRGGGSGGGHHNGSSSESSAVSSGSVTSVRSQEVGDVVVGYAGYDGAAGVPPSTAPPTFVWNEAFVAAPSVYPAVVPAVLPISSPQPVE